VRRLSKGLNPEQDATVSEQVGVFGKIITSLKSPFGLVIIGVAAVVIIGTTILNSDSNKTEEPALSDKTTIQVIEFEGKHLPISEMHEITGPECDGTAHMHANNGQHVISLDETEVLDPGECGFGRVNELDVIEIELEE